VITLSSYVGKASRLTPARCEVQRTIRGGDQHSTSISEVSRPLFSIATNKRKRVDRDHVPRFGGEELSARFLSLPRAPMDHDRIRATGEFPCRKELEEVPHALLDVVELQLSD